jgi:3-dehydroquinate dehydratase
MADWNKIKTEYITTDTSYRKLAQKYGLDQATIAQRGKKEDWVGIRKQKASETQAKIIDAVEDRKVDRATRLQSVADKLLDKVEALVETGDLVLMNSQAMKHISGVLKDIKEIQMIRSDADMREQEARIANLRKQAEKEENTSKDVTITIEGGDPKWQS